MSSTSFETIRHSNLRALSREYPSCTMFYTLTFFLFIFFYLNIFSNTVCGEIHLSGGIFQLISYTACAVSNEIISRAKWL